MELRDLQIFVAVAEAGGFRRASQQLGLDASAVSRRVSMLEDGLGVSLFERNRAGVRLTGAGRRFLTDTRLALSHLDGAVRTASAAGYAGEGMVKIGVVASVSSSFPNRLIRAFKADFPNVALDIVEGSYGEHLAALMERTLDVAFVMDSPKPPGCEVEGLWSEPILAALPADDPRCARGVLDIQDMAADLFIVSQAAPGPHVHDFIVQRLASLGFMPRINQHRVGREGLMAMVGLGFGLSVICGSEASVIYPGVTFVPLAGEAQPFSAIWSPDNDNPALRRFLSAARVQSRRASAGDGEPPRKPDPSP